MRGIVPEFDLKVPATLKEVLALLAEGPRYQPFAGGTDIMVLLEAGHLKHRAFVSLGHLPELHGIQVGRDGVDIGAATNYGQIQADSTIQKEFPNLCRAGAVTGSIAIQNRGTLGGNIANASPAGDSLPALMAYDAQIELVSVDGSRWVPYRTFHTGYKTTVMKPGEVIRTVRLPRHDHGWVHYFRKVGTREAQAISKIVVAATAKKAEDGALAAVRIAYGSVGPKTMRCEKTETILLGEPLNTRLIQKARDTLLAELTPIDDIRSTGSYRREVSANLLVDLLEEVARS